MERYAIKFIGRKIGAIGICQRHIAYRSADNAHDAVLAVYDNFEHLSDIYVNDIALKYWNKATLDLLD